MLDRGHDGVEGRPGEVDPAVDDERRGDPSREFLLDRIEPVGRGVVEFESNEASDEAPASGDAFEEGRGAEPVAGAGFVESGAAPVAANVVEVGEDGLSVEDELGAEIGAHPSPAARLDG